MLGMTSFHPIPKCADLSALLNGAELSYCAGHQRAAADGDGEGGPQEAQMQFRPTVGVGHINEGKPGWNTISPLLVNLKALVTLVCPALLYVSIVAQRVAWMSLV